MLKQGLLSARGRIFSKLFEKDQKCISLAFITCWYIVFPPLTLLKILYFHYCCVWQVTEFLRGIRTSLAESLFAWSCQTPLIRQDLMLLFNHLRKHAAVDQTGCLDEVTIALSMSYLYSIDISNVEPRDEDRDGKRANFLPRKKLHWRLRVKNVKIW